MSARSEMMSKVGLYAAVLFAFINSSYAESGGHQGDGWSEQAKGNLAAIHNLVAEAHPGALDDPMLRQWLETGLLEAGKLAERAASASDMLAVMNYYATGFRDDHLAVVTPWVDGGSWAGFQVERREKKFVVASVAKKWPLPLPDVGSEIMSCDGRDISTILREDISPYVDRRLSLESVWNTLSGFISVSPNTYPVLARKLPTNCDFRHAGGTRYSMKLVWQEGFNQAPSSLQEPSRIFSLQAFGSGIYWIRLPSFYPDGDANKAFGNVLSEVREINDGRLIIVDVRGNRGGHKGLVDEFLAALPGAPGKIQTSSVWRVSKPAIDSLGRVASDFAQRFGDESKPYRLVMYMHDRMREAYERGDVWLPSPANPYESAGDIVRRPRQGRLVVVTDGWCASACLSLMDNLLSDPEVLHVGAETNADTRYTDIGFFPLSGGLQLAVPFKRVTRSLRTDNQPYVPRIIYPGDMSKDEELQEWVLRMARKEMAEAGDQSLARKTGKAEK